MESNHFSSNGFNDKMDRNLMLKSLDLLNDKLRSGGEDGEILVFGGAAMCLSYGGRQYTRDIDAIFEPKMSMYESAREVAKELNLPEDWLNDGVKGWLYKNPERTLLYELSNLKVFIASPEYILAMKCHAARVDTEDLEDAKVLVRVLGLKTPDEVFEIVESFIPKKYLSIRTTVFVEDIFNGDNE